MLSFECWPRAVASILGVLCLTSPLLSVEWNSGDVAVAGLNGTVLIYDGQTGALKESLGTVVGTTGECTFSPGGDLFLTDESNSTVVAISGLDPHAPLFTIDTTTGLPVGVAPMQQNRALVFDQNGNFYVGDGVTTSPPIHKYDGAGNFLGDLGLEVFPGNGFTSLDLAQDQATFTYTSIPDNRIKQSAGGSANNIITLGGFFLHTVRILPPGDGSGGYLIAREGASSSFAKDISHVMEGGTPVVQSYDAPGADAWRSIAFSPDGTKFWGGSGNDLYRFDIATGAIELGPINVGTFIHRLAVVDEWRAAGGAAPEPDPNLSALTADPMVISSFAGVTTISVNIVDADSNPMPGLNVNITSTAGTLLGTVVDHGNGCYTQDLEGAVGPTSTLVAASAEGIELSTTLNVAFVPIDPDQSTLTAIPDSSYFGGVGVITLTPVDDLGQPIGSGANVVLDTTVGNLIGDPIDNGDGSYSQGIQATSLGTANVTATVDGLVITTSASFTVLDPVNLGAVFAIEPDGTEHDYTTIQEAVNRAQADNLERIFVTPGIYDETVLVRDQADLTIEALSVLEPVTVQGFRVRSSNNVSLRYFEVDATNSSRRHGVRLAGNSNSNDGIEVLGCEVHGANRHGIKVVRNNQNITIDSCESRNNGRNGIGLGRIGGPYSIVNCLIHDNGYNGIRIGPDVQVSISTSTIENNGTAAGNQGQRYGIFRKRKSVATPEQVTLTGNVIQNNNGRLRGDRSDQNLGNFDQIIDATDSQSPYTGS